MKTRFRLIFALFFIHIAASGAAHAGLESDLFLGKYNAAKDRLLPMAHADSPFYPYHGRDFEEGLDESRRILLREAQEEGNCGLVDTLMVEGFLSLFPFLKPAFADDYRRWKLTTMISSSSPPTMRRCRYHSYMSKIFSKRRREEFRPVDFVERHPAHPNFRKWKNETGPDLKKLRRALGIIGKAALCDDYRPSIADLIGIVSRPGGLALTPQEELYLVERARLHNLSNGGYDKAISRLKKHFDSRKAFSRLRDASRVRKLAGIPFTVKGYWQGSCRNLERFRREELFSFEGYLQYKCKRFERFLGEKRFTAKGFWLDQCRRLGKFGREQR